MDGRWLQTITSLVRDPMGYERTTGGPAGREIRAGRDNADTETNSATGSIRRRSRRKDGLKARGPDPGDTRSIVNDVADTRGRTRAPTAAFGQEGETRSRGPPPSTTARVEESAAPARTRYTTLDEIGRGAMSRVWRAHDARLDREVALKELRAREIATAGARRLVREARVMAITSIASSYTSWRISEPRSFKIEDSGPGALPS